MKTKIKMVVINMCWILIGIFLPAGRSVRAAYTTDVVENASDVVEDAGKQANFLVDWLLSQRSTALDFLKTIIAVIIVYLIGKWIIRILLKIIDKGMKRREVDLAVQNFVLSFAKVAFLFLLVFVIAGMLGFSATVVAIVGSAGLAIGLALQGSLSNLAGGILILALKPFTIGDYIIVADAEGTVQNIDIFYTRIRKLDNTVVVVPNGAITGANITNTTKEAKRMVQIDFFVDFETDLDELKDELMYIMKEDELLIQDEPMDTVILKIGAGKVQMQLRAWAKQEEFWAAHESISEKVKKIIMNEKKGR